MEVGVAAEVSTAIWYACPAADVGVSMMGAISGVSGCCIPGVNFILTVVEVERWLKEELSKVVESEA